MIVDIAKIISDTPVVPLVQADDAETAVKISRALAKGGLRVAEVLFRTDAALECLKAVDKHVPEMIAGAGTVLSAAQAQEAIDAGAKFIVSPGLDEDTVKLCQEQDIPIYAGTMTPSEVQRAFNLGLRVVKFFPGALAGGTSMLKTLGSVFRQMKFMPTGGVSIANLPDFLAVPSVLACGGSWLTPAAAIEAGNFDEITKLAAEAVAVAREVRG